MGPLKDCPSKVITFLKTFFFTFKKDVIILFLLYYIYYSFYKKYNISCLVHVIYSRSVLPVLYYIDDRLDMTFQILQL